MAAHELTFIAMVAGVALICGIALARLKQPAIVGYIVAGIVLGPSGFELVEDRERINVFAELGVLMLLFLIGMELSLRGFKTIWRVALLGTVFQIAVALAVMLGLSQLLGWPLELAVLLGFVIALSSTAVAIKMLEDIGELRSEVGRRAVGILIAQDLAVVPMMLTLNAMAQETGFEIVDLLPITLAIAFLAAFVWYLSRRQRIRLPLGGWVVGDRDLTPLAALALCFGAATISGLMGLSAAYGAFLAGMLIGNSTERAVIVEATRPIQSVLLMLFFLSIGLLIDFEYIWANIATVVVLLVVVTLGKTAMNVGILRLLGEPWHRAFLAGVVLGQVGEFSFVLAALGLANGVIASDGHRIVVTVIALSLVISPLWLDAARRLDALAASGISTLNQLLGQLYSGETAAVRRATATAAGRISALRLNVRKRLPRRGPANPGGASPEPTEDEAPKAEAPAENDAPRRPPPVASRDDVS